MYYPDTIVEEVRSANNIVDVISQYVHLTKKGGSYFGLCPFHNEKTPSFSVSEQKQMYYCFGCGAGGNVITFLMEYENLSFPEALTYLAERAGIKLPEKEMDGKARREADRRQTILNANKEAARYYYAVLMSDRGKIGREYLEKRRLSEETIRKFGLGYSDKYSDSLYKYLRSKGYKDEILRDTGLFSFDERRGMSDKFWNRVIFPILDVNQRVIAFGGRVMGDAKPKYLNSPETVVFDKSQNLYGLYLARKARSRKFILCEGYMDVIALHQAGFSTAVASLGTSFTEGQARLLKRYAQSVYLVYDSDQAGVKAIRRAWPILHKYGIDALVVHLEPYKDPDEFIKNLGAEAFQERLSQAENGFLFGLDSLRKDYDLAKPEEKTRFMRRAAEELLDFQEEIERSAYTDTVAGRYGVTSDSLKELVRQAAMTKTSPAAGTPVFEERKKKRNAGDDAGKAAQRLLLTWIADRPDLFPVIRRYVFPEDFSEGVYRIAAEKAYEQAEAGRVVPASIISLFSDEAEQSEAASLFHASLTANDEREFTRAVKEAVRKVKSDAIETMSEQMNPTDMAAMQRLLGSRKALEDLDRIELTF